MQTLLREGGQDLDRLDGCVSHASLSKFQIFSRCRWLANPFSIRFGVSAVGAAARAAGGMPEYGEYPSGTAAAGGSKNKKQNGGTPWAARRLRDGHRLRCVGLTLWATPTPSPPLHCTGVGTRRCTMRRSTAILRPSARSSTPAHRWTSRTISTDTKKAGGPLGAVGAGGWVGSG